MDISYSRTTCNCLQIPAQCTYKIRMTAVYTKVLFSKTTAKIPMGIAQMNFEMNLYTYSLFLTFLIFFPLFINHQLTFKKHDIISGVLPFKSIAFTTSFGAAIRINFTSRICPLRIALNSIRASVYSSRCNSFSIFKSDTVRSSKFDLESVLVGYTFTLPPERLTGVLNRRTFLKVWDNGFLGILRDMLNHKKQYCICCINLSTSSCRRPRFSYTLRNPLVNYNLLIAKITYSERMYLASAAPFLFYSLISIVTC